VDRVELKQAPLSLLCVEPRFPGRLGAVCDWLVRRRGYRAHFFCAAAEAREHWPESVGRGLDVVLFGVGGVAREAAAHWTRSLERGLCYAFGCWEVLEARRPRPVDLVLGRSAGLGSTLFAPVHLPGTPVVNLLDYFYHPHRHDLAETELAGAPAEYFYWRRGANAVDLLDLENGVTPWAATAWQRDLYPAEYRDGFVVLHPGVDTDRFRRRERRQRRIAGRAIPDAAKVVTFVARGLDRVRGFDRFVRLANRLLALYSDVICVAAGAPTVQRGLDVDHYGRDYAAHVLGQVPLHDPARFWSLGFVPPATMAELLAASDLHVYPSRTYPVAASLLEAMASDRVVLAWDGEPLREVLTPGRDSLLVPPDDEETALRLARAVLDDPAAHAPLGEAAAALVRERYAEDVTLPRLASLFERLVEGRR
jgi:glycosyltransferase involved in cell wall biosynthesis